MVARVLVVDDEADLRWVIRTVLATSGYDVVEAADGAEALAALMSDPAIDLVVLDRMLPGMDGIAVLDGIRRHAGLDVPVIMLTGLATEADRISGLDHGADDYLVKPFSVGELEARVRALLRRSGGGRQQEPASGLVIDRAAREVRLHGEPVALTRREFDLLAYLAERPRTVVGVDELLEQVWNSSSQWQDPATVKEHVRRLRLKLDPAVVRTVRGAGFLYDPEAVSRPATAAATATA